jgi:dipeptidyl aminopeptidase/acylaminoacyl peptidase
LFYPPKNKDFTAPAGVKPPLIVISHGGPTSATTAALRLSVQYWTSRGYGVVDVNYGGSTGYGRDYRERLKGNWGIVDVDDCINAARYLEKRGDIDGNRMAIRGGSAGGFTTLCALVFHKVFAAGASYYGVADLETLAHDTHKFESRYEDNLVGPYPAAIEIYKQRSPVHFADRLSCPVILLQGLEDKVVPPSQAEVMIDALRAKRLPFAYVAFPTEGHGFREAANIQRSIDAELYFYSRIFGFTPADRIEPVVIENLK